MPQRIKRIIAHPLFSGSVIVSAGNMVGNVFNYLFHLSMGRLLTPANYGVLTALISFITIFGILSTTVNTVTAKFVSTFEAQGKDKSVALVLRTLLKRVLLGIFIFGILFQVSIDSLKTFLHISDSTLLYFTGIGIMIALLGAINSGALQGLLKFFPLALYQSGGSLLRLLIGITLVKLGFGVRGAVAGFFLSYLIPYGLTFIPLKRYFSHKVGEIDLNFGEVLRYTLPTMIALGGLGLFMSTDVILVKHFFSETEAGLYSALSVIGRVIFFGTGSIALVMFPVISGKYAKGEDYSLAFFLSFFLVVVAAGAAVLVYFLFPEFIIKLFYSQEEYLREAANLGYMGVFFALHSVANLLTNFFLSISLTRLSVITFAGAITQGVLIYNFHADLRQVIFSSIAASGGLVLILGLYYTYGIVKVRN